MITIFSGTNRRNSQTALVAKQFHEYFKKYVDDPSEVQFFSLENLPQTTLHNGMYTEDGQNDRITAIQDQYVIPAKKFFFIFPEYNGSFPGTLKLFLDACSIREYKRSFKGKKAALVGVSSGRAGNLRGMDHFSDILHHVGTLVMPNKLPISNVSDLTDEQGYIIDEPTLKSMKTQVKDFLSF